MKKGWLAIAFVALLVTGYSCKKDNEKEGPEVCYFGDGTFPLKKDQSIRIAAGGDDSVIVTLKYVKMDSRCPINANCVTAGTAIVVAALNGANETEFELNKPKQIAEYRGHKLAIELIELTPYPVAGKEAPPTSEYMARFKVSELP